MEERKRIFFQRKKGPNRKKDSAKRKKALATHKREGNNGEK